MADSVLSAVLECSAGTMDAILSSMMLKEFMVDSRKAWTWLKNSMPMTIFKSSTSRWRSWAFHFMSRLLHVLLVRCSWWACQVSLLPSWCLIGTMEKSSFPFHIPSVKHIPCAVLVMGLAGEFTAFMVLHKHYRKIKLSTSCPECYTHSLCGACDELGRWVYCFVMPSSFVTLRLWCLASSLEIKLCVAPVFSNTRMAWPLMDALTYMSLFFVGVGRWLLSTPRRWRVHMLCWGSSVDGMEWSLSWAARALNDFFFKQSRSEWGPLHRKHGLLGCCFSYLLCPLLLLGGFFYPQSFWLWPLSFQPSPPPFP